MFRIDELLGVATLASAGLFVAIALQPVVPPASQSSIEVVASRGVERASSGRQEKVAHRCMEGRAADAGV